MISQVLLAIAALSAQAVPRAAAARPNPADAVTTVGEDVAARRHLTTELVMAAEGTNSCCVLQHTVSLLQLWTPSPRPFPDAPLLAASKAFQLPLLLLRRI
jgi:hypothetical protein